MSDKADKLREAVAFVHEKFVASEAAGYRSRERQFAIDVLGKALEIYDAAPSPEPALDAATIEECAKVAEESSYVGCGYDCTDGIASAIRSLSPTGKEKAERKCRICGRPNCNKRHAP